MQAMDILKGHIQDIKSGFAVKRIGIYGSFSRGEEKESSDIDILVEFEKPTFRNFMNLSALRYFLWLTRGFYDFPVLG